MVLQLDELIHSGLSVKDAVTYIRGKLVPAGYTPYPFQKKYWRIPSWQAEVFGCNLHCQEQGKEIPRWSGFHSTSVPSRGWPCYQSCLTWSCWSQPSPKDNCSTYQRWWIWGLFGCLSWPTQWSYSCSPSCQPMPTCKGCRTCPVRSCWSWHHDSLQRHSNVRGKLCKDCCSVARVFWWSGFESAPVMQVQLPNVELHLARVDALVWWVLRLFNHWHKQV